MSLIVFTVAVVGLVALQSRAVEASLAARELRDAERIAQEVMADLESRGFLELATRDFQNAPVNGASYADVTPLLRDARGVPSGYPDQLQPGRRRGYYAVYRRVSAAPAPALLGDPVTLPAVVLEVNVLWIDTSNPTLPPPAEVRVQDLTFNQEIGTAIHNGQSVPWVGRVQLRTVRVNDAGLGVMGGP